MLAPIGLHFVDTLEELFSSTFILYDLLHLALHLFLELGGCDMFAGDHLLIALFFSVCRT